MIAVEYGQQVEILAKLALSSKTGPKPVWVIMIAAAKSCRFGLAHKVADLVGWAVIAQGMKVCSCCFRAESWTLICNKEENKIIPKH